MNSQDILRILGFSLDIKLDNSQTYDFSIAEFGNDYDSKTLDNTQPFNINSSVVNYLGDSTNTIETISLCEIDNTSNDSNSTFSGITYVVSYTDFVEYFNTEEYDYENIILNNDVFTYTGLTNSYGEQEVHYFKICKYNEPIPPTPTPTSTLDPTLPTPTPTGTPFPTATTPPPTPTSTIPYDPMVTPTPTDTSIPPQPTSTPNPTATYGFVGGTPTPSPTQDLQPTPSPTSTPDFTPQPTGTETPLPTIIPSSTPLPTNTETPVPTATVESTPNPTETPEPTSSPTPPPSPNPTSTPQSTPNPTETPIPSATPQATPDPTITPNPTATPIPTATPQETPDPTSTPQSTPNPTPTQTEEPIQPIQLVTKLNQGIIETSYSNPTDMSLFICANTITNTTTPNDLYTSGDPTDPQDGDILYIDDPVLGINYYVNSKFLHINVDPNINNWNNVTDWRWIETDVNGVMTVTQLSPCPTNNPTATPTPTDTPIPTSTPLPSATPNPSPNPTSTPNATPQPTATENPTATPMPTSTQMPTPNPTATPAPTSTPMPTPNPTATSSYHHWFTKCTAGPNGDSDIVFNRYDFEDLYGVPTVLGTTLTLQSDPTICYTYSGTTTFINITHSVNDINHVDVCGCPTPVPTQTQQPTPSPTSTPDPSPTTTPNPTPSPTPQAWSPNNEITPRVWIDASDSSSYTRSGTSLTSVTDKAGTYTMGILGNPTTNTSNQNGLNVFDFDGSDSLKSTTYESFTSDGNHWAIGVFRWENVNSNKDSFWSYETDNSPKRDYAVSSGNNNNLWPGELDLDGLSSNRISSTIGNLEQWSLQNLSKNNWYIVACWFNKTGNQIGLRVDGTNAFNPVNDYDNSLQSRQDLRLMRNRASQELDGKMGEFIDYPRMPGTSGTDMTYLEKAEGYLAHKWGLSGSLPPSHPYKNSPPTL